MIAGITNKEEKAMTYEQERITDPTGRIKEAYGSPLFLAIAIIMSAVTLMSLYSGGINVFYVLTVVGMWITFDAAKKDVFDSKVKGLTIISGTAKATMIVMRVAAIILIVCSIVMIALCATAAPFLEENDKMITVNDVEHYMEQELEIDLTVEEELRLFLHETFGDALFSAAALLKAVLVILAAGMLIGGVLMLVLSLTFYKTWHRFCRSVCENVKHGAPIEKANSLKAWLIVLSVFAVIGALGAIAYLDIAAMAEAALYIVGYVWIKKYFCEIEPVAAPSVENTDI